MSDNEEKDDREADGVHLGSDLTSWRSIREDHPLNERAVAAYGRLMEAESRLYRWWEERQTTNIRVAELLSFPVEEADELLWIAGLGEKVAAMGGHLEITAVFDNEALTLLREPGHQT
jgi:hypothetical protein